MAFDVGRDERASWTSPEPAPPHILQRRFDQAAADASPSTGA
jgi:hypothetical protein